MRREPDLVLVPPADLLARLEPTLDLLGAHHDQVDGVGGGGKHDQHHHVGHDAHEDEGLPEKWPEDALSTQLAATSWV